jgi:hypothetical protein
MFELETDDEGIYGSKADCWAIGVLIYYIWKRKLPFVRENLGEPIERIIR